MVTALTRIVFDSWVGSAFASVFGLGSVFTTAWLFLHWLGVSALCILMHERDRWPGDRSGRARSSPSWRAW